MQSRIEQIIRSKNLTPSRFADEIGIQRSGLSHILSGRNKPSLDFIQKILNRYPDVDIEWLITGKPRKAEINDLFTTQKEEKPPEKKTEEKPVLPEFKIQKEKGKKVVKVIILYSDYSVEEYRLSND